MGKINVICGKNNSGKTTLLKNIESNKNILVGNEINEDEIKFIESYWNETVDKFTFDVNIDLDSIYSDTRNFGEFISEIPIRNVLSRLSKDKRLWFSDERDIIPEIFWNNFYKEIECLKKSEDFDFNLPGSNELIKLAKEDAVQNLMEGKNQKLFLLTLEFSLYSKME